jgi:hypothetical protein
MMAERPSSACRFAKKLGSAPRQSHKASVGSVAADISAELRRKAPKKKIKTLVLPFEYGAADPRVEHLHDAQEIVFPDFLTAVRDAHNSWQASLSANKHLFS